MAEGASGSEGTGGIGPRDERDEVTRRKLLAGAGGVTAAGALAIALPEASESRARRGARQVGSGLTDRDTLRFVGQIDQHGTVLTGYGYFTEVRGLTQGDLFLTPPAKTANDPRSADPSAARFTFTSYARIGSMSAVGDVLSAVARGSVRVFHQPQGGARFDDPASFGRGSQIAHFVGDMQNNLSVDGPNQGAIAMSADLVQRASPTFSLGRRRRTFGRRGLPWGMRATGRARRTEPTTPRAELSVAGTMGVIDAR